jgi:hypothetical protein
MSADRRVESSEAVRQPLHVRLLVALSSGILQILLLCFVLIVV